MNQYKLMLSSLMDSARDLLPIVLVIGFFQYLVLRQPIPNMGDMLLGTLFVVIGLTLFVRGLDLGLFPIGQSMANAFARKGSLFWLLLFAFSLGFSTTVAEPALIAVAAEAAEVAAQGHGWHHQGEAGLAGTTAGTQLPARRRRRGDPHQVPPIATNGVRPLL